MILFSVLSTLSVNSQPRPGPSGTLNLPSTGCQSTVQSSLFQGFKLLVWVLVDHEIGDDALQMQRDRRGERAGADVSLDADIVDIGHIADLLALRQAAAVARSGWITWMDWSSKKGAYCQREYTRSPWAIGMDSLLLINLAVLGLGVLGSSK